MTQGLRKTILAYCTTLMLAVLSAVSAHHMAPDRDDALRMEAFIAMGSLAGDLCGLDAEASDHRCPFCHKLPRAAAARAPDLSQRVQPVFVQAGRPDLVAGHARLSAPVGVRAPPLFT